MIRIEDLSKRYDATTVVDHVSFSVERDSITVIVGTSGSGKSTLLRMINRLVEPSSGRVLLEGSDTRGEPAHLLRRRIGYVIQGNGLFPHRTVAENIATVPRLLKWDESRIRARVEELLHVFQLDPATYAQAFPHQLSGGQQQRVALARALAIEPEIVLLDEPFSSLDAALRTSVRAEVLSVLRGAGTTSVLVTHDQEEALSMADQVAVLRHGTVAQLDAPSRLYGHPEDAELASFLGESNLLDIQRRFGTTIVLVTHDMDEAFRLGDRVAVMSQGRLLQYDHPATLLTHPADPFVSRMTGIADRAMKLLSLTTAGEAALPGGAAEGLTVPASASLREVLSELLWRGATCAVVLDEDGTPRGQLTVAAILARGRP